MFAGELGRTGIPPVCSPCALTRIHDRTRDAAALRTIWIWDSKIDVSGRRGPGDFATIADEAFRSHHSSPGRYFPNLRFVNELPGLVKHCMPRLLVYMFAAVIPRRRMPTRRSLVRLGIFRV